MRQDRQTDHGGGALAIGREVQRKRNGARATDRTLSWVSWTPHLSPPLPQALEFRQAMPRWQASGAGIITRAPYRRLEPGRERLSAIAGPWLSIHCRACGGVNDAQRRSLSLRFAPIR